MPETTLSPPKPVSISPQEQEEIRQIYEKLLRAEAKLIGPDGRTEYLPNNIYSFLLRLLADLKAGNSVTILQSKHELTTVEAAKVLGMSRQYLIQLLEQGKIPDQMSGPDRRTHLRSAHANERNRDHDRPQTL